MITRSRSGIPLLGNAFKPWKDIPAMWNPSRGIQTEPSWPADPRTKRSRFGIRRHGNVFKRWKDIPDQWIPSHGILKEDWLADLGIQRSRFGRNPKNVFFSCVGPSWLFEAWILAHIAWILWGSYNQIKENPCGVCGQWAVCETHRDYMQVSIERDFSTPSCVSWT